MFRLSTLVLWSVLLGALVWAHALTAQALSQARIESLADRQFPAALTELRRALALPNDGHYPEQMAANAEWCTQAFYRRGYTVQPLTENGVPFVLAYREYQPGAPWLLFYLQIDGQPVDPAEWDQPDPFQAVLKARANDGLGWITLPWDTTAIADYADDWRIFARSASDSKGPAVSFLHAIEAVQRAGISPSYNIKVIMDFQEEMSSPQLPGLVLRHRDLLAADALIIMDGTRHISNLPTLTFGAKGMATATLRVFGPREPMHSGQYGNYVPNPVFRLAHLLASMKDERGRVTVAGFYDGIALGAAERSLLRAIPEDEASLTRRIGIAQAEAVDSSYQEAIQYPTLNVRGLQAAYVGDAARTIIPEEALALLDVRLVPESTGERLLQLLRQHIIEQGFYLVAGEQPTEAERQRHDKLASFSYRVSYEAFRTPFEAPVGQWLRRASVRTFGSEPVMMRTTGGSQPIAPFISTLGLPAVSVRMPNPDNNIHAPNENLRIGNFREALRTCIGILTESY